MQSDHIRFAALPVLIALVPSPAFADALQQQIVVGARAVTVEDFSFTQTSFNQRNGQAVKEYITTYDPEKAKASRWALIKVEGRAPTPKETAAMAKRAGRGQVPSYADIAKWFGAPATRVVTGKTSVTYRFASLPAGSIKFGSHDASANTVAEAVVNISGTTPFVERVHLTTGKPFRIMMVAKINLMEMTATYQMMGNGKPAITGTTANMTGSMMGKAGWFKTRTSFSDIRAVR